MPPQVNALAAAYELLKPYGIARWSLFFLIPVGRGKVLQPRSTEDDEELMAWIYETTKVAPLIVATTASSAFAMGSTSCSCRTSAISVPLAFCLSRSAM